MFAAFSGVDVFLGPATTYTSYGNIVNIPEISIPYAFAPATVPSNYTADTPRKSPQNVGIYGLPYSDSKVRHNLNTQCKETLFQYWAHLKHRFWKERWIPRT